MRRIVFLLAVVLLTTAGVSQLESGNQVVEWESLIKEKCSLCIEGERTQFEVTINNKGSGEFAVRSALLVDSDGVAFSSSNLDIIIPVNGTKSFSIDSIIPPATRGKTLYYKMCFVLSSGAQFAQSCEDSIRRMVIQDNSEVYLMIIYILLSAILIVMVGFFLLFLRKMEKNKR